MTGLEGGRSDRRALLKGAAVPGAGVVRSMLIRALRAASTVIEGVRETLDLVVVGLIPREAMVDLIREEWEDFGEVTREPDPRLFAWEREFYGRYLGSTRRVLVVGCGTGRELIPLVSEGHRVVGLDMAPDAVATCARNLRDRGLDAPVHVGSMDTPPALGRFDVVIYSWWCFDYLPGWEARQKALMAAVGMLEPHGRLLISYLLRQTPGRRLALGLSQTISRLASSGWRVEEGDHVQLLGVRQPLKLHFEHRFTPEEIEAEARRAGLSPVQHEVAEFGRLALGLPAV